ncbi:MAG: universal stress protein [Xanthomonadales bacterium]|jgi:nucleotide-binding universal stress UspA family protein|nr:universal stress protein [Xanthomonadales bacterium]
MHLTTLVTQIEPGDAAAVDAQIGSALTVAAVHAARVIALLYPTDSSGAMEAEAAEAEARTSARLRELAERYGVPCQVRTRSSFAYGIGEVLADHLRVADLGVLNAPVSPGTASRILLRAAIFDGGRPVLVVPAAGPLAAMPTRVLVAWDASPAAVRATHGALPFLQQAVETVVLTVTDDKELRAGQSGIELASLLARHGVKVRFSAVPRAGGDAYDTMLAAAEEFGAELLVMGAVHHSPLHQLLLGSATDRWLKQGPRLPMLLAA